VDSVQSAENEQEVPERGRWFQRVVPVTGLALLVIALAALVVPPFRDQVRLSVSRQNQPYVELYFSRQVGPEAQAICVRTGAKVGVRFTIASHLDSSKALAYRVVIDPNAKGQRALHKSGSAHTFPGKSVEVREAFALPRRAGYTLTVTLPGVDQHLRARCSGRSS
jgi:hypothetical protein